MSKLPPIQTDPGKVRQASWKEYAIRFLFGGTITAVVGILAKTFGPVVAGLFLAFPAILPASLTLLAKQEGNTAAAAESMGAVFGAIGMIVFGLVVWIMAPHEGALVTLVVATVCWLIASVAAWMAYQVIHRTVRNRNLSVARHLGVPDSAAEGRS